MSEHIDQERRRFLGTAAAIVAAAQLGLNHPANSQPGNAQSKQLPPINPGTNTSFGALKQINAGQLSIGYADVGPSDAPLLFFCTAGPTTFTVLSTSHLCWRRPATA